LRRGDGHCAGDTASRCATRAAAAGGAASSAGGAPGPPLAGMPSGQGRTRADATAPPDPGLELQSALLLQCAPCQRCAPCVPPRLPAAGAARTTVQQSPPLTRSLCCLVAGVCDATAGRQGGILHTGPGGWPLARGHCCFAAPGSLRWCCQAGLSCCQVLSRA